MGMFDTINVKENTVGLIQAEYQTKDLDQTLEVYVIEGNRISLHTEEPGGLCSRGNGAFDVKCNDLCHTDLDIYTDEYNGIKQWLDYTVDIEYNEIVKTKHYGTVIYDRNADEFDRIEELLSNHWEPKLYRDPELLTEGERYNVYLVRDQEETVLIFTNLSNPSLRMLSDMDLEFVGVVTDYDPTELPIITW